MPRVFLRKILWSCAALAPLLLAAPAAATDADDLCTGDPCNVTGPKTFDPGSDVSFPAGTDLVFKSSAVVTLTEIAAVRTMAIHADSITLEPGARIIATTDPNPEDATPIGGSSVLLEARNGDLLVQAAAGTAKIDTRGNSAGSITLIASAGIVVAGDLLANGAGGEDPTGGGVDLSAGGTISLASDLSTTGGGEFGSGGEVAIAAEGSVSIDGAIDTSGGGLDGGDVTISSATGDVTTSKGITAGAGVDGGGGAITLSAPLGDLTLGGAISGVGSEAQEFCGDGSDLTLEAGGTILVGEPITVRGGAFCAGGDIAINAGEDFAQAVGASITASASGADSTGGPFTLFAGRDATLRAVTLTGVGAGAAVEVTASGTLSVLGAIDAKSSGVDSTGGSANLTACTLDVASSGTVDTRGDTTDGGGNTLTASGQMTVAGTLRATTENRLVYRSLVPITAGATIDPGAILDPQPGLPSCASLAACGDGSPDAGEVCDDGNNFSCDGCAADCARVDDVCGDGDRECGEQCDDGNTTGGDGCEADCTLPPTASLLFPGSPRASAGCQVEWELFLADGAIDDSSGLPRRTQTCIDGDPGCDADGGNDLRCHFDAQLCLRVQDERFPACAPGAIELVKIGTPSPLDGSNPVNQANGQAIADALAALGATVYSGSTLLHAGSPQAAFDHCTAPFSLAVPHTAGNVGKRKFNVTSEDVPGVKMKENEIELHCRPNDAICANGAVEGFEQCDDGDTVACDGCSPLCRNEECGNGTLDCGEQCDDGPANGTPASRCSTACTETPPALRIPGGGGRSSDCAMEWSAELAASAVAVDRKGLPKNSQRCTDGDPACDFDPAAGTCRMKVWACLGGPDTRLACGATQVSAVDVTSPKVTAVGAELAARTALVDALAGLGLPAGPGEECTGGFAVDVPAGGKLKLRTRSRFGPDLRTDSDSLKLRCVRP